MSRTYRQRPRWDAREGLFAQAKPDFGDVGEQWAAGIGLTSPMIIAIVVVLPAPLPPSSPVIEPAASRKETPSTASTPL